MKVFIVIQTSSCYDGWHGSTDTDNIGVYSTKELAKSHCPPDVVEQNEGDECTTSWHYEEWNIDEKPIP